MTRTLVGTNWFGLKTELDRLVAEFVKENGDLALEKIDLEESELDQLLSAVEALPFLSPKKMVVAYNMSAHKDAADRLPTIFERISDTTELILVETKIDKRSSYYKLLKKQTDIIEFNQLDQFGMEKWVQEFVQSKQGKINPRDANYLVDRVGLDQTRLSKEIEKLLAYNQEVTKATIVKLTDETPTSTVFNLLDSAFSGNPKRALQLYDKQRLLRVEPQAMMGMLVWQMHIVNIITHAPKDHTADQIARDAGLNPYVVKKSQTIARQMGRSKVKEVMDRLTYIDRSSKTKAINYDDALKHLILSLSV